jgi:lipid-A-disaccharide synthase
MTVPARPASPSEIVDVFLVAAEESGDRLGAALMRALRERTEGRVRFAGVGGREMAVEGITSLYPIDDLPIIGFSAIPRRLPRILRLMRFTAKTVVARRPHVLVIIDSPGFTRGIARRVRDADPKIAIVEYVSPSVWAWRPGRARVMRAYIDHILALLPFEPAVHRRLGGPPCTYVGHPLVEEVRNLRPNLEEARRRLAEPPVLLVLPGSRTGEIERLLGIFADAVTLVRDRLGSLEVVVATVPHLLGPIQTVIKQWPLRPRIVVETAEKQAAFRIATAALAKSGTVTLELALAGVPMIAAYKVSAIEYFAVGRGILKRLPSIILTNLLLGENVVPELLQHNCTAEKLAAALLPLFGDTPERRRQIEAFSRLDAIMEVGSSAPAPRAADIVLAAARDTMKTPLIPAKAGMQGQRPGTPLARGRPEESS